jgi:hypothetical protein
MTNRIVWTGLMDMERYYKEGRSIHPNASLDWLIKVVENVEGGSREQSNRKQAYSIYCNRESSMTLWIC